MSFVLSKTLKTKSFSRFGTDTFSNLNVFSSLFKTASFQFTVIFVICSSL
ncbi:MAG: hypothetical protein LBU14_06005 [Candidatus Peribacteria bacterium]|nr:hypothetical protein [Candidatus Peribacteria bacterium]